MHLHNCEASVASPDDHHVLLRVHGNRQHRALQAIRNRRSAVTDHVDTRDHPHTAIDEADNDKAPCGGHAEVCDLHALRQLRAHCTHRRHRGTLGYRHLAMRHARSVGHRHLPKSARVDACARDQRLAVATVQDMCDRADHCLLRLVILIIDSLLFLLNLLFLALLLLRRRAGVRFSPGAFGLLVFVLLLFLLLVLGLDDLREIRNDGAVVQVDRI
mmetsp:Transcript_75863/g.220302  ORF Transcript_75863/g.220302 Transcript_75863/m.220302 type:complete len:216 (-) Transcript_75863:2150-2797(-)